MANRRKLSKIVLVAIWNFLNEKARTTVLAGSRFSGKTFTVAQFIAMELSQNPKISALVIRENFSNLRGSIYQDFLEVLSMFNIEEVVDDNKVPLEMVFPAGNSIVFAGLQDPKKIKGKKKAGTKFKYMIVEEAQNIIDGEAVLKAELTAFRGQKERHTIIIMNTDIQNWVYDDYFAKAGFENDVLTMETTGFKSKRYIDKDKHIDWNLCYNSVFGNKFLEKEDLEEIFKLKENNYERYLIDGLGMWGNVGASVYGSVIKNLVFIDKLPDKMIDHTFGVDYGEKNSATTCSHLAYEEDYQSLIYIDAYYHKNHGSMITKNSMDYRDDIVNFVKGELEDLNINDFMVIVDSAAQVFKDSILIELEMLGYKNFMCIPSLNKNGIAGKFEVLERINLTTTLMAEKRFKIYTGGNYEPLLKELRRAVYDENSAKLKRKDAWNDILDGMEYAMMNRYKTLMSKYKKRVYAKLQKNKL